MDPASLYFLHKARWVYTSHWVN